MRSVGRETPRSLVKMFMSESASVASIGGPMFLSSGDFYLRYRPADCDLRLYLRRHGVEGGKPSPYEDVIRRLGKRRELAHLATFPDAIDLRAGTAAERRAKTLEAMRDGVGVIYQPMLHGIIRIDGADCELGGAPDFLIREDRRYTIRDVKMSRRINEKDHPEILYGRMFEQTAGAPPLRLEVFAGTSEVVPIDAADGHALDYELAAMAGIVGASEAPFEPVG